MKRRWWGRATEKNGLLRKAWGRKILLFNPTSVLGHEPSVRFAAERCFGTVCRQRGGTLWINWLICCLTLSECPIGSVRKLCTEVINARSNSKLMKRQSIPIQILTLVGLRECVDISNTCLYVIISTCHSIGSSHSHESWKCIFIPKKSKHDHQLRRCLNRPNKMVLCTFWKTKMAQH